MRGLSRLPTGERFIQMTDSQVRSVFAKAGLNSIGRLVHSCEMRHFYARTLINGGVSIEAASQFIGHSDPKTAQQWYYRLTIQQRKAIQKQMPA